MEKIKILKNINTVRFIIAIIAFISIIIEYGFYIDIKTESILHFADKIIALTFVISFLLQMLISENIKKYIQDHFIESIVFFLFIVSVIAENYFHYSSYTIISKNNAINYIKIYFIFVQIYIIFNAFLAMAKSKDKWLFFPFHPSHIIIYSFFIVIFIGTFLLKLPKMTNEYLHWADAIFLSTSAVCVTGLTPVIVSETFTISGQVLILLLIQIGGLGIITLTSFVVLLIQKKIRLKEQIIIGEMLGDDNLLNLTKMVKTIIKLTFAVEIIGAIFLYFSWNNMNFSIRHRIFSAVFQSVSAYCNAGFSNFKYGLETFGLSSHIPTLITIMVLIIIGGLGFYTLKDLIFPESKKRKLKLQTKIILIASGSLILFGAIIILILQWNQWSDIPFGLKIVNALFASVTSRTAGFSNIDIGNLMIPAAMIIIVLMYIGGAPNSTAGGIKITTFTTLFFTFKTFISGKDNVEIGWNTIGDTTIKRVIIILFLSIILIFTALLLLNIFNDIPFFDLLFETFSAFGTVGLSRGITADLSEFSKIVLVIVMFLGRVGLFTIALAIGKDKASEDSKYKFPELNLMVG
ncbi:MAG: potassium transporter TrkG [Candidatus Marinimicrobia bacterium]|nr:potassium transporter TrkG [Candidatus Neomarinimicrobiota bacterium]